MIEDYDQINLSNNDNVGINLNRLHSKANNPLSEIALLTLNAKADANFLRPKLTLATSPEEEDILHTKFHIFSINLAFKESTLSIVVASLVDTVRQYLHKYNRWASVVVNQITMTCSLARN